MDTPLPELAPLPPGARALFKPPFQAIGVEGRMLFVYDSAGRMVASRDSRTGMPIPRGHGRHCYLPNGLTHHDAWCDWFEANVPGTATLEETTKALNRAWAAPP